MDNSKLKSKLLSGLKVKILFVLAPIFVGLCSGAYEQSERLVGGTIIMVVGVFFGEAVIWWLKENW